MENSKWIIRRDETQLSRPVVEWNNKSTYCCRSCCICCSPVQTLPAGTENDAAKTLETKGFGGLFLAVAADNNHQTTWHREIGAWLWFHQELLADIHQSRHTCQPSHHCEETDNPWLRIGISAANGSIGFPFEKLLLNGYFRPHHGPALHLHDFEIAVC